MSEIPEGFQLKMYNIEIVNSNGSFSYLIDYLNTNLVNFVCIWNSFKVLNYVVFPK